MLIFWKLPFFFFHVYSSLFLFLWCKNYCSLTIDKYQFTYEEI